MESVSARELRRQTSPVLRRFRPGERVAVTDRGTVVAVLVSPSDIGSTAGLLAAGRVHPATATGPRRALHRTSPIATDAVLDELRADAG